MNKLEIVEADLNNAMHAEAIVEITNAYANDKMGLGMPLPNKIKQNLIGEMKKFPCGVSFIAFVDGKAAGLANCVFGFSTFNASKVLNIHDLAVLSDYRSMGIGQALMDSVEKKAQKTHCCKITLEVREDNRARNLYERTGFSYGSPVMYFMTKELE